MWAKIPAATTIACAACIAAAAVAVPAMEPTTDYRLAKTIATDVNLAAINFGNLDLFSAIPAYEGLFGDDPLTALEDLDLLNGIPAYVKALGGDFSDVELLNGIPGYLGILGGDFSGLSSTNGIPAFENFFATGDLHSFVPVDEDPPNDGDNQAGYDALSGAWYWQNFIQEGDLSSDRGLGGIAAFSAIPTYQALLSSSTSTDEKIAALGNLDSVNAIPAYRTAFDSSASIVDRANAMRDLDLISAIPEYLGLPEEEDEEETPTVAQKVSGEDVDGEDTNQQVTAFSAKVADPEESQAPTGTTTPTINLRQLRAAAPAPQTAPTEDVTESAPEPAASSSTSSTKTAVAPKEADKSTDKGSTGGSYSGNFKPKPIILFGSGKGGGADNGIRGWDKVVNGVRGAVGLGPDKSTSAGSASKDSGSKTGGDSDGGGDK